MQARLVKSILLEKQNARISTTRTQLHLTASTSSPPRIQILHATPPRKRHQSISYLPAFPTHTLVIQSNLLTSIIASAQSPGLRRATTCSSFPAASLRNRNRKVGFDSPPFSAYLRSLRIFDCRVRSAPCFRAFPRSICLLPGRFDRFYHSVSCLLARRRLRSVIFSSSRI